MPNFLATGWLRWVAWHFLFWTQEWLGHAVWAGVGAQRPLSAQTPLAGPPAPTLAQAFSAREGSRGAQLRSRSSVRPGPAPTSPAEASWPCVLGWVGTPMPGGAEGWASGAACIGGGAQGQWRGLEGPQEGSVVYGGPFAWGLLAWALGRGSHRQAMGHCSPRIVCGRELMHEA